MFEEYVVGYVFLLRGPSQGICSSPAIHSFGYCVYANEGVVGANIFCNFFSVCSCIAFYQTPTCWNGSVEALFANSACWLLPLQHVSLPLSAFYWCGSGLRHWLLFIGHMHNTNPTWILSTSICWVIASFTSTAFVWKYVFSTSKPRDGYINLKKIYELCCQP